ncbi:MAG TPA: tetraacyldisaccharide 4'-kinase [Thermoanaerobaculia bacterium]|nr:tetraacyldisaccharide 4'-kinase [Thermoanaerobaculia bacterium]
MSDAVAPRLDPPAAPRSPWQRLYAAAHRWRRHRGRRRAARLPRPVVSIGNLHWGGGGKTPLTAALATHLRDAGHQVAILSRGYRARGRGTRLVSGGWSAQGEAPLLDAATAGDEPVELARALPGVAVVVDPDRAAAGRWALDHLEPPPDLFLLDDGFSHVGLARDLDLLAFPAADPFAGGRLFPSGRLREPLASARWADAALLTGLAAETPLDGLGDRLAAALAPHGFAGRGFACRTVAGTPHRVGGEDDGGEQDGEPLDPDTPLLLVSAIARPERFAASARAAGLRVAGEIAFRDHHDYPPASLERIRREAAACGAGALLTTAKDRGKLAGRLGAEGGIDTALPLAVLPVETRPEPAFWAWFDERLGVLQRRHRTALKEAQ